MSPKATLIAFVSTLCLATVACQPNEGPAERAGQSVDQATEKAGQSIQKAGERIEDKAEAAQR